MIQVVLVEDEPHARAKLKKLIEGEADLKLVAECADGPEALRTIVELPPDLVLLDIDVPGFSRVARVKSLEPGCMPQIVVTTAYSEHAVWAFDTNAVDYLLNPYDAERFRRALHRVRVALRRAVTA